MGSIAAQYDLMPESTDVVLEDVIKKISETVPKGVKVVSTDIVPVAFGLKKIILGVVIDDSIESIGSDLENALGALPGIENIECVSSTLLM